jgi:hypothetical protein
MATSTYFLLLEYSGIPIGLLLYSVIIRQLSNADPIPLKENIEEVWTYGLELMVILSVSTLLYGISFAGHSDQNGLPSYKLYCIIWCLVISIIEFFFLIFLTLKVRQWGKSSSKTKQYPNLVALIYWAVLVVLILLCNTYVHDSVKSLLPPDAIDLKLAGDEIKKISWLKRNHNLIWLIVILIIIGIALAYIFYKKIILNIKRKAIKEYNKGSLDLSKTPITAIKNLQDSLKNIPSNSPLIIDIYMKLSGIYSALFQSENALLQIQLLEATEAYKALNSYLKDGIIKRKIEILISQNKIAEVEQLINSLESKETADKLRFKIFKKTNS